MRIEPRPPALPFSRSLQSSTVEQTTPAIPDTHQATDVAAHGDQGDPSANEDGHDAPHEQSSLAWRGSSALVPLFLAENLPVPTGNGNEGAEERRARARDIIGVDVDIRELSAREMSEVSLEIYVSGLLSWDDYAELAFQPELHPDYNATTGALLGEPADPDQPRDFIRVWEERLAYERRYHDSDVSRINTATRITGALRSLAGVMSFEV